MPCTSINTASDSDTYTHHYYYAVSPFHYDSPFTMSALSKLEGKGFPIVSALDEVHVKFADIVGVSLRDNIDSTLRSFEALSGASVRGMLTQFVVVHWLSKECLTWGKFFEVLKKLSLDKLSQDIEDYLSSSSGML